MQRIISDRRLPHALTILIAGCVGLYIAFGKTSIPAERSGFDMLTYLDEQVAIQENEMDVRCWSSFCKLQMFLAGAPISDEAISVRIERHMDLIESIWLDSQNASISSDSMIAKDTVLSLIARRFPMMMNSDGSLARPTIGLEALQDYSDTIEPWRLLQAWASRKANSEGQLVCSPQFSREALHVLYEFLGNYDLAILTRARNIALERRHRTIDGNSMSFAFESALASHRR